MKKLLLTCSVIFITIFSANAQHYDYNDAAPLPASRYGRSNIDVNRVRFGVFVAPTLSWMHPTSSKSDDGNYFVNSKGGRAGFIWGLMADYYFAPNYGISLGFDLNNTGGKIATDANPEKVSITSPNTVLNTDFTYKTQFLEVPFALKLRSDQLGASRLRAFGQIGITLAINISKKVDYTVQYNNAVGQEATASADNEKLQGSLAMPPVMLELNLGAGIEYPISHKMSFYTGLFFNNGFLPDATNPANYTLDYSGSFKDGNVRQNNLALRIGIFF